MSDRPAMEKTDLRRLVEASAWRTHLTEAGLESSPAFDAWIAADPRNRDAWDRVQKPWDLFAEHAMSPELLELRREALAQMHDAGCKRWGTGYWKRSAIAAGIGIVAVAGFLTWSLAGPDVYRTGTGERRVITLTDGSQVQLDTRTELRVAYSERARDLTLVQGQARFDVAQDVERPFSVLAAGQKVVATGTAFNVDLLGKDLFVTLIEGRVMVLPQNSSARAFPADRQAAGAVEQPSAGTDHPRHDEPVKAVARRDAAPIELTAGQQLRISAGGAPSVAPANVQRTTAWQNGQLVFDDEPLSSVIVRVNRYATRPLSVADAKAASMKISGVFNAGDTEGFIATLTRYLPVTADYSDADTVRLKAR